MKIHPFRAWRPKSEHLESISCVPYDVIDTAEARQMAEGKPDSFLHVIRPEIDLPTTVDTYDGEVYQMGYENLQKLLKSDKMVQDDENRVYFYRLTMDGGSQVGVFTCVSVDEYDAGTIKKHEQTRPDKEDDRTKHILTQNAHAEPVMLIHREDTSITEMISAALESEPLYDFTTDDGVRHELWSTSDCDKWVDAFGHFEEFYIADGHHRCRAASRVANVLKSNRDISSSESSFFPAVIFSADQMQIMAYNRLLFKVDENKAEQFWKFYRPVEIANPIPGSKGQVAIYHDGTWKTIQLVQVENPINSVQTLDAYRLQKQILEPIFGIADPRSDKNIAFVGGIRGTKELERRVDSGEAAMAFSMHPTSIEELLDVSDQNLLMPPKSTWFEPKLRSGLLIHTF